MRKLLLITLTLIAFCCGSNTHTLDKSLNVDLITNAVATNYANTINTNDLKTLLYQFASDEFEGRETGEPGQKLAAEYLKTFYINHKIKSPYNDDNCFQTIPTSNLKPDLNPSENVAAFIKGTEKPDEIVVISAHYDHLGKTNAGIYYGADDDGSGTVAILEIAEAFQKAVDEGNGPKRSILFLHFTGEEKGLLGSKYYSEYPIFPLDKTVTDLNIDMIGRVDDAHINNTNYVYLIGSDKLSKELHFLSEEINEKFTNLNLDYTYNDENDPNRFYYRSDHYNFAKNNIPIIFYFNGTHKDYHKMTDTPDKINYDLLSKRAKLVFYTAWEIANRENRIALTN
jgi:Zn-dependent M28 family amino/carboxypeptidase